MSKKTDKTLQKCDELIDRLNQLKKALTATNVASSRRPVNALGAGWSQDPSTGAFHHSTHGVISTSKHPDGYYQITHGGRSVGRADSPGAAGIKIKNYIGTLQPGDSGMHNLDPMSVGKSDYGPKGGGQYSDADNARRKMGNVGGEKVGTQRVKAYSKNVFSPKVPKGAAGPVKQYTPEQIAAINEARKLKKTAEGSPWVTHGSVPNADQEVVKLQADPAIPGEDAALAQLTNLMASKNMMHARTPSSEEMIKAGERMFGVNEQTLEKQDQQWGGAINNWLVEAQKPISSRFTSEEEEMAYWSSLKTRDNKNDDYGF